MPRHQGGVLSKNMLTFFKKIFYFCWEIFKIAAIALAIVIPIRYFVFQPFIVQGASMEPNFSSGDYLIVDELSYRFREPQRGEVVVFYSPQNISHRYIKRIIGLPGETIEAKNNQIFIHSLDGTLVLDESSYLSSSLQDLGEFKKTLAKDEYFVLGDNRSASLDSRTWGVLPRKNIIGRALLRVFPLREFTIIRVPDY